jgi:hypothetical protein
MRVIMMRVVVVVRMTVVSAGMGMRVAVLLDYQQCRTQ